MIRVEVHGDVGLLLLDRPEKRNALTPPMLTGLRERASDLAASARAIVLAGEGAVFCAGFDLDLCRRTPDGAAMRALLWGLSHTIRHLRRLPVPIVGAAHGAAIAGGCALLGACDVVVADRAVKLGYPVVRLGVSPAVSAPFLRLGAGDGPARSRLLDPALIDGDEALRIGLAHDLVERPGDVRGRAIQIASALAAKSRAALAATRAWLAELDGVTDALADEALAASLRLTGYDEERERLAALTP